MNTKETLQRILANSSAYSNANIKRSGSVFGNTGVYKNDQGIFVSWRTFNLNGASYVVCGWHHTKNFQRKLFLADLEFETNLEYFYQNGIERPICQVKGCNKGAHNMGRFVGDKSYLKHRKDYCENIDGRLGVHCTSTITVTRQLTVDHIDENHNNNDPLNLQTLCGCCHVLKDEYVRTVQQANLLWMLKTIKATREKELILRAA